MIEVVKVAAFISTPISLLAFISALVIWLRMRVTKNEIAKLKHLPVDKRARILDEYLTRYEIDGADLTAEQRFRLILNESNKKNARERTRFKWSMSALMFMFTLACASWITAHIIGEGHARKPWAEIQEPVKGLRIDGKSLYITIVFSTHQTTQEDIVKSEVAIDSAFSRIIKQLSISPDSYKGPNTTVYLENEPSSELYVRLVILDKDGVERHKTKGSKVKVEEKS